MLNRKSQTAKTTSAWKIDGADKSRPHKTRFSLLDKLNGVQQKSEAAAQRIKGRRSRRRNKKK